MQYQVPQFIETEDKIVGPLTLKQFLYLAAAGIISFLLFFVLKLGFWLVITIFLGFTAAAFAFIRYNGRPLPAMIVYALKYAINPKLYLWKSSEVVLSTAGAPTIAEIQATSPLKNLWLKLTSFIRPTAQRDQQEKIQAYKQAVEQKQTSRRISYR